MTLKNLFSIAPEHFISALKTLKSKNFLSLETAKELDKADPLGYTSNMFDIASLIPFAGHSLGPNLKILEKKVSELFTLQKKLHAGHFPESHPEGQHSGHWFDCDRHLPSLLSAQQLIGFKEMHEFTFTSSGLSQNLGMLIETFFRPQKTDWSTGKTKILMLETEFFSDQAIAYSVIKRSLQTAQDYDCFEDGNIPTPDASLLRIPANADGLYNTEDIIQCIRTHAHEIQLICFPDIVFSTGQRLELSKIFQATRDIIEQNNIRVILDLAHSIGNRAIDLSSMPVTAAVGCAYKHLSGPAGSSFGIYVSAQADLKRYPPIQGWKAADASQVFKKINSYDDTIMTRQAGATAFRTSNPPPLALAPVQTFLTVFGSIGFKHLFEKSERLTLYLIEALKEQVGDKIDFITPIAPNQRGATICIRLKKQRDLSLLEEHLKQAGYEIDTRPPNVIRITAHYGYIKFSHIHQFVQTLKVAFQKKALLILSEPTQKEENAAKELIEAIQQRILQQNKWELGWFGGESISIHHKTIKVPKGIKHIWDEMHGNCSYSERLASIEKQVMTRKNYHGHTFFNKRHPSTQDCYEEIAQLFPK